MSMTNAAARSSPRVILRTPRDARFGDVSVLVLELGLGGAKFEHPQRMDVGRSARFTCGTINAEATVRYTTMFPTLGGIVYHSGIEFTAMTPRLREQLTGLLLEEAQEQVREWEENLEGVSGWRQQPTRQSAVLRRFLCLQFTNLGWQRRGTSDPNQPLDGVTIPDDTPEEELKVLQETYERGDHGTRELLRAAATMAILERMR